jgi:hypothetical protein
MSTVQQAQAIGKTGDPFWIEVVNAYETVSIFPDLTVRVERGDKAADVYFAHEGNSVVVVITPLMASEMSLTKIETHGGISDKSASAGKERE